jgi:hypothetical protein
MTLFLAGMLPAACSSKPAPAAAEPAAPALWGELKPVVTVKQLMNDLIDPASDFVFNAVGTVISGKGIVETEPKTDDDWAKVRVGAVTMAEGIYLLKIPRPIAPPGDVNNSVGPDASELTPDQIKAKIEADTVLWNAKIEALRNINLQVLEIVKRKDAKELSEAGEILDQACESCHLEYWYPAEKDLMKKLDRRLTGR